MALDRDKPTEAAALVGGGGTQSRKRVLTVAPLPRSCGCHVQKLLKWRGCSIIMNVHRELSNLFI